VDPDGRDFAGWLLDSLRSGVVAIDAGGALRVANPSARRILGLGASAAPGRPCEEALGGEPLVPALLRAALRGGESPGRAELSLGAGAAAARSIGFTLATVRDGSGAVRGSALLFRDLEPLERMDEQERLRHRLAALGEMAAGLAHEIRNPLASLGVVTELLRRRLPEDAEARALAEELRGEIRALEATVGAALAFVKPAAPAPARVDAVATLEAALAAVRARVTFEGRVERDYAQPAPTLIADADQLRGALANLVANALEALEGAPDPRLALRVAARPGDASRAFLRLPAGGSLPAGAAPREVVIEVADNGPGVPEVLRERIFYPFFSTKRTGSGVGLALAHKVVVSHGGALELDGTPGGGATFRVVLPEGELG
jgi:nitrogen-specific signal transduction histidine kinase